MDEGKRIRKALVDQGWRLREGRKHLMAFPPDQDLPAVTLPSTPSDHRAWRNAIAQLRRSGFLWPPPGKGKGKP